MMFWGRILGSGLVLAAVFWAVLAIREEGAQAVRHSIERQNDEAADRADAKRRAYDACLGSGGVWDFGTGRCDRLEARRRH